VQDEVLVLVMDDADSRYFGLRGVGPRIWQLLEAGAASRASLVRSLAAEYAADPARVAEDVDHFIDSLVARGLVLEG